MRKIIIITVILLLIIYVIISIYNIDLFEINNNKEMFNFNNNKERLNIYIISNINVGGANKYIKNIIDNYPNNNYIYIKSNEDLNKYVFMQNDIVFIQHICFSNININNLINKEKNNCKVYLSIHDYHWLYGENTYNIDCYLDPYYKIINSNNYENIKKLFNQCIYIIHPSKYIYDLYSKYYDNTNFIIQSHNDYYINTDSLYIPSITNNTINIGNLSGFDECKGKEYILNLIDEYKTYKNYNINFVIVGYNSPSYNETEYYDYVKKYNIHGLTYLNKWGETWCYSLTKALNTGLPIIYNNIGAFKERITDKPQYFKAFDNEYDDIQKIYDSFNKMLDYIIENNGKYNNFYSNSEIIYYPFYDNLFN